MITVNGGSASKQKYAYSMAVFVCQEFDISPTVEINIKRIAVMGTCLHLDDNEFEVEINNALPLRELLITLAHELVHVKQHVLLEMPASPVSASYWDRPHEIEAHDRELELFIKWRNKENLHKRLWAAC
jgi:hypothetical protein